MPIALPASSAWKEPAPWHSAPCSPMSGATFWLELSRQRSADQRPPQYSSLEAEPSAGQSRGVLLFGNFPLQEDDISAVLPAISTKTKKKAQKTRACLL